MRPITAIRLIATLLVALMVASCDPTAIAPLPSPVQPDDDRIVMSSLTVDEGEPTERLVAVVGFDGAVTGLGDVEFTNTRSGATMTIPSTEVGAFTTAIFALPGDTFDVRFSTEEGLRSDATQLQVAIIMPADGDRANIPAGGSAGEPADSEDDARPEPPKVIWDNNFAAGGDCEDGSEEDCPGEQPGTSGTGSEAQPPSDPDSDGKAQLAVEWWLADGELHITAEAGFTSPNAIVVAANQTTGGVHTTAADSVGGVDLSFPAQAGDQVLMFTQNPGDASLTSEAIAFTVPAAQ